MSRRPCCSGKCWPSRGGLIPSDGSMLHGCGGGWRKGRPVSMLRILPSCRINTMQRHHIARPKRRVTNWAVYNEALRQRGSLTVWFTDEAVAAWKAAPAHDAGRSAALLGPGNYDSSDGARGVPSGATPDGGADRLDPPTTRPRPAGTGARQGQRSYFSTLSQAGCGLGRPARPRATGGVHLLVDSSGLREHKNPSGCRGLRC